MDLLSRRLCPTRVSSPSEKQARRGRGHDRHELAMMLPVVAPIDGGGIRDRIEDQREDPPIES